jgi:hypothetical protein
MSKLVWCLVVLLFLGVFTALVSQPAAAQAGGEYADVSGLNAWSPESNYMSLAGYLRWMTYTEKGVWLSMAEAKRIVAGQLGR